MYDAFQLKELTIKPRINDFTLRTLCSYYEMFLHPFIYRYKIVSEVGERGIELRFDKENFCHLLGIESIAKYSVPRKELYNYRGDQGWNNIEKGVIDIPGLKSINKKKFNSVKAKYVYFYLLPRLIENPLAVNYDIEKVGTSTKIDCEILFYSIVENDNAIIHLGIERGQDYYIPRTFFVEKVDERDKDIYISQQEEIEVITENRVIMQGKR